LNKIYQSEVASHLVFKGGTSLSKCYEYVNRFSEDIDLVLLRQPDENGNQLKLKLKKITNAVSEVLPELTINGITNKMGIDNHKLSIFLFSIESKYSIEIIYIMGI
jgi:predicted nucleotidyltransferase component of viral defense system